MVDKLIESNRAAIFQKYGKTEEDVENDINQVSKWLEKQSHLPPVDARLIELYLTRTKFSLQRVKQAIELYFTIKHAMPEIYDNWDIESPDLQTTLKTSCWIPLRKLTPNVEAVGIFRLIDYNPQNYSLANVVRLSFMMVELRAEVECNNGDHMIFDLKGFTLQHILKLTPTILRKGYVALKNGYAFRMAGYHILNAPENVNMILSLFKPMLSTKMYNRIQIHKDLDSLYKVIPKDILPKDYGGDEPSFDETLDKWKILMENSREKLIKLGARRSNESKRLAGNYLDEIFGSVHGSFRQLQID